MPDLKVVAPGTVPSAPLSGAPAPFVGRQRERAELHAALDGALSGHGRLFLLAGEPGIGKTRLADELTTEAVARGATVVWGRCWEGGGVPAYWPWIQILRSCIRAGDPAALEPLIARSSPLISALVPELRADGEADARQRTEVTAFASTDPPSERFRLFDAVALFLRSVSSTKPLVVVFDDGHAADMASLLMLQFIARDLRQLPLMLVVTYRETETRLKPHLSELMAELGREGATLTLQGLSEADVQQLIESSTGQAPNAATVEALYRVTEGNPFFLSEIVRLLIARGQLDAASSGGLETFRIPDSVRAAIRQRVGLASEAVQGTLAVAAVLGREFDAAVIGAVTDLPLDELMQTLDEAESCGIVTRVAAGAGPYRFAHALIPETLYHHLSKARRRELHLRIARAIEEVHRSNLAAHFPELAHHYSGALPTGPVQKAVEYARQGALNAEALHAYQEAARLYQLAIDALELQPPVDDGQRCALLLGLGEAMYGAGLFNRMRTAFESAADAARRLGSTENLARAALGFGMPPLSPYHVDEALVRLLEEALAGLADRDDPLRAMVLARLAAELYWSDARPRGAELSRHAVEMARRLGDSATLISVLYTRHLAAWSLDNLDERLRIATEIVSLAEEPSNRIWATRVWGLRAHYFRFADLLELGDIRAVDAEIERYARLAAELRQHLGYEELARATRALMEGRFDEAERMTNHALEVAQRLERRARAFRQAVNSHLLILRREQQRLEELAPIFSAARARAPQSILARCSFALCLAELGQRAEAAAEFEQLATGDFARLPHDGGRMAMMVLLTEVCAYLHDAERAALLYRMLLPYAGRNATLDVHVCYGAVSHYLGVLATVTSELDRAEEHFQAAFAFNHGMAATLWEAHTRYRYAAMLFERDRPGDCAKAAELAEGALATAESLGMKSLAAKVRAMREANPSDAVTIVFTDIEDSAGMTERLGDVQAQELIHTHNAIVREHVAEHKGVEVKSMGDGFMIAFSTSHSALRCAIAVQRAFAAYNERRPDACISVSIGLHTGQAIREGRDFYGKTVILAARIRAHARGGEILVSSTLRELTEGVEGLRFGEGREVELKGFGGTHRLYAVLWRPTPAAR